MNKKILSIDLILPEKPVLFFGTSTQSKQSVKGKLKIVTSQPIHLSQIEICYKLKTHLHWRDDSTTKCNAILFPKRMTASKTLRKTKQLLVQHNTIVPEGTTEMDFEVFVPSHLCPSFQSEYCQIKHIVSANLVLPSKLLLPKNAIVIEKCIQVKKTCIPKEVLIGVLPIPRLAMTGERENVIQWSFQVPTWVCLQDTIEFEGIFHTQKSTTTLNKIQVDVMQEELYYYDVSCIDIKRRLVTNINSPSTYIEPPLDTIISFSFPLFDKNNKNNLIWSLDSPFLQIRHFIRVILHVNNCCTSICIGLPIQVTPQINVDLEYGGTVDDILPTYQTVINQGEKLPKYKSRKRYQNNQHHHVTNESINDEEDDNYLLQQQYEYFNSYDQPSMTSKEQDIITTTTTIPSSTVVGIVIGERSMKEFCAII